LTELDASLRRELDRWRVPTVEPAWDDVRRRARRRRGGGTVARAALVAVGAVLVVLAAAPALGLWSPRADSRPAPVFAEAGGAAGTAVFEAATPNTFVVRRARPNRFVGLVQTRRGGGILLRPGARLSWTLRYEGGASIRDAWLRAGVRRIRLCGPCAAESSGMTALTGAAAGAVFNGRSAIVVRTDGGTLTGRVVFDPTGASPRPRTP
jgi:hypothetical protein